MTPLPHSEETERAVLASVLLRPSSFEELDLRASDFYLDRHQLLYATFRELSSDGEPIDMRTVQARLEQRGAFQEAGGLAYLTGLDLDLPDLNRIGSYARIVRDLSLRRRLVKLGHRLTQQACGDSEVPALAAAYRSHLEDVEGGSSPRGGMLASDLVASVLEDASSRRQRREETGEAVFGLRTGLPRLDRLLCGLNRGLYLLAGAPGVGKTSLGLQMALHVARSRPVVYVTFENSASSLVLKALCASASLKMVDVARGFVDLSPLSSASAALSDSLRHLQVIEGDGSFTVGNLRAVARRALEQQGGDGPCLLVIDYLQLWAKVSRELHVFSDTRTKVDALGGELIGLARRLDSPVLALSSQSRAGGGYGRGAGRAALDSLKESGDLEYSADVALFLTPEQDSQSEEGQPVRALELALKKNRHGPTGSVAVTFQADRGLFRETDTTR